MRAEILMIGTELLIGQINDTNAQYLGQTLAENGINLYQKTTVGDNRDRIIAALDGALNRADVVICSGGLGPTEDDITRECVGAVLNRPMEYREELFEEVLSRFAHLRHLVTENNKKQAILPVGAVALSNPRGTAPGVLVDDARGVVICLPGVPHELKGMMEEEVLPFLRQRFSLEGVLHYEVLKVCGMGESRVDALIGDIMNRQDNPTVGLLANPEATRIRIAARATNLAEAQQLIAPVAREIEARLPGLIMGRNDDTLESVVAALFRDRQWKIAVAETSTGGMIAQRLTLGGPDIFAGAEIMPEGAVAGDAESALDLAEGLLLRFATGCALALVHAPCGTRSYGAFVSPMIRRQFEIGHVGSGARSQLRTAVAALEQLRRALVGVTD